VATLGEDKLRATAGKIVLDYGSTSSPAEQVGDSAEDDWWKAAEG